MHRTFLTPSLSSPCLSGDLSPSSLHTVEHHPLPSPCCVITGHSLPSLGLAASENGLSDGCGWSPRVQKTMLPWSHPSPLTLIISPPSPLILSGSLGVGMGGKGRGGVMVKDSTEVF